MCPLKTPITGLLLRRIQMAFSNNTLIKPYLMKSSEYRNCSLTYKRQWIILVKWDNTSFQDHKIFIY